MINAACYAFLAFLSIRGLACLIFLALIFIGAHKDWREDGPAFKFTVLVAKVAIWPRRLSPDNPA